LAEAIRNVAPGARDFLLLTAAGIALTLCSQLVVGAIYTPKPFEAQIAFQGWLPNILLFASIVSLPLLISRNWVFSFILALVFAVSLSAVHAFKMKYLHEPLYISDFLPVALRTFFSVLPGLGFGLVAGTLAGVLLFTALLFGAFRIGKQLVYQGNWYRRFLLCLIPTAGVTAFCALPSDLFRKVTPALAMASAEYNRLKNFRSLGVGGGLLYDIRRLTQMRAPSGYPQGLAELAATILDKDKTVTPVYDHVVILLLESFWDPTRLERLGKVRDPLPGFHALERNATHGTLIVPAYGGGTIKTEFEVLTGLSTAFVDGFPYNVAIRRPVKTLASVFKAQGFKTKFIHGHRRWFYGRNNIVPLLGFDSFIADDDMDRQFRGQEIRDGLYVRDEFVARTVLSELDRDQKNFIYASTYITHAPFSLRRSQVRKCAANRPDTTDFLDQNCKLLSEADEALAYLIREIRRRHPKTLIAVFGDHYPSPTYINLDFFSLHADYLDVFRMPLLIIDPLRPGSRQVEIGASALGGEILRRSGLSLPGQFGTLAKIHTMYPDFSHWEAQDNLNSEQERARRIYHWVQFDTLYGQELLWAHTN